MEEVEQRESTFVDYGNTLSPFFIPTLNPELKFNPATDTRGGLDFDEPEMKTYFDSADIDTQRAMLRANNNSDAIKISQRRDIFKDSQEAISQDGLLTQIGMGLPASMLSPSTLLPMGAAFKIAQTATKINRTYAMMGVGGGAGVVANVFDEAIFDAQGMPTSYLGAAGVGLVFGGALGGIGAMLSGPNKNIVANALHPKNDSFTQDFDVDRSIKIELDENGIPKIVDIAPTSKSWLDRVPGLGKVLRSDIHQVYQEGSNSMRSFMSRLTSPTVSLRDSEGNLIPTPKNAVNVKKEADGIHQVMIQEITQSFEQAKKIGYKGDLAEFNTDIWKSYSDAMNIQRNALHADTKAEIEEATLQLDVDFKTKMDEVDEDLLYYRDVDNKVKPMTEELLGKVDEEKIVTKKDTKKNRTKLKEELKEEYTQLKEAKRREIENKYIDDFEVTFKGDDTTIKGAESYRKYFQEMLQKSQKLGIKELQGINLNRLYAPRVYDYKSIKSGKVSAKQVESELRAGIVNDVRNSGLTAKQVDEAVKSIQTKLNESAFNLDNLSTSYMVKDLPFSTHLKQVKLFLNESYMPNLLKNSMEDLTGAYHYKMAGRQGIQYAFGTDDLSQVQKIIRDESLKEGVLDTDGSMLAFERIIKDVAGDLRMNQLADTPQWTWTRNIATGNSLRLGGGFGGNQFIELISSVMMQGTKAIFSGRFLTSLNTAGKLLYTKNPDIDKFSQFLINGGHLENVLHTSRINRYADNDSGFNSGWLENTLNGFNDKLMKINGMRYFTGVMEDYTGGAIMTMLKEGNVKATRIARWGLTPEQATNLGAKLKEATKGNDFDVTKLTQQELDQFQLAIHNGIQEMVVQGDSLHLPNWLKAPTPVVKLLTQFMRFPMIAQEVLLRKGLAEEQAQMAAGTVSSIMTFIGIKYLREQAAIATGTIQPIDAKYNYSKYRDEDWLRVIGEAVNYTAPLGMMTAAVNYGAIATGNPEMGRDWVGKDTLGALVGPTGGGIKDMISILTDTLGTGEVNERTYKKMKNFVPAQNLPIIKEALDEMVKTLAR